MMNANSEPEKVLVVGDGPKHIEGAAAIQKIQKEMAPTETARPERGKMTRCPYCGTRRRDGVKCCSATYAVVNLPAEPLTDERGRKIDFQERKHGRPRLMPMKLKEGSAK